MEDINLEEKKLCYKCQILLPITEFRKGDIYCRECGKRDCDRQSSKKSKLNLPDVTTFNELGGRI